MLATELMSHFESCLGNLDNSQQADAVRQAIVVLMGSLAKHMDKDDPKVNDTSIYNYFKFSSTIG